MNVPPAQPAKPAPAGPVDSGGSPPRIAALAALALLLAGCGGDGKGPNQPPPADLSTPAAAALALEDAYSLRDLEDALRILATEYRFFPTRPESIPFLAPGETFWDLAQEQSILELLLVEERTTWIDQVLLEITRLAPVRDLGNGRIEYEANVQLKLLIGADSFESAESNIIYVMQVDAAGDYHIVDERESPATLPGRVPIGELRARVLEDRGGAGG